MHKRVLHSCKLRVLNSFHEAHKMSHYLNFLPLNILSLIPTPSQERTRASSSMNTGEAIFALGREAGVIPIPTAP